MIGAAFESCNLPNDAVLVAHILDAWGVKGGVKIAPYSASPQALFSSRRWYLLASRNRLQAPDRLLERQTLPLESAHAPLAWLARVKTSKLQGDSVVATLDGIVNRDEALALKGYQIYVPRSSFPTPEKDEYYWVDLIGLPVQNREGVLLGTVREILSAGPQSTLVITPDANLPLPTTTESVKGHPKKRSTHPDLLIPFVSRYVDQVDLSSRIILVDWQLDYSL